jgi:uncharacterized protein (DUF1697 family)
VPVSTRCHSNAVDSIDSNHLGGDPSTVMSQYIALIRAVNVGGTGSLTMSALKSICVDAGFGGIQTYIASGNVVFSSKDDAARVKSKLEQRLRAHIGKSVDVFVRTAAEMRAVLEGNPFPGRDPRYVHVFFLGQKLPRDAVNGALRRMDEEIRPGEREIYVYYPVGMGKSKLQIPAATFGTARNMNTVAKLVAMSSQTHAPDT